MQKNPTSETQWIDLINLEPIKILTEVFFGRHFFVFNFNLTAPVNKFLIMVHFAYSFLQYDEEIVLFIFPVTAGDIMLSWNGCVSPKKRHSILWLTHQYLLRYFLLSRETILVASAPSSTVYEMTVYAFWLAQPKLNRSHKMTFLCVES